MSPYVGNSMPKAEFRCLKGTEISRSQVQTNFQMCYHFPLQNWVGLLQKLCQEQSGQTHSSQGYKLARTGHGLLLETIVDIREFLLLLHHRMEALFFLSFSCSVPFSSLELSTHILLWATCLLLCWVVIIISWDPFLWRKTTLLFNIQSSSDFVLLNLNISISYITVCFDNFLVDKA